ncbi:uncharacterized protein si:ch211-198p11.6 [Syngnathoides biaculeatus]|uniref:uncharacterized protein si:ch211-198p11.6 n=1 Tax=Syngnathoides biaculeatus TaxID=300417 RepID=UPI002ADDF1AD|nr:uncharacterized protein si:ch211-198p11.6 [Syngnathoides biaculeatus]XP_061701986.1 uncharacterized protein si:ch211-198p11.6 [Syngnathoides biaculeatus]XP_061701987.1 uncharacterized protein si:ch211-198p11.6 [Syngnathoides biaculeatus]XP_061701988.1 uncharacterized protein si:ch211-198p11.6 [Syngnathoides biaculeatus]XP_061701989.1 uncharacterized protein si:ch211-198p11.6 [Syngnathoides biaculeatus]XP_061701990.1 uncharacterized protein si:ch211-198p11.6 [Syngnathoides biaculeatus]XP_06
MSVVPVLGLAVPLPAIIMIGITLYMLVLGLVLWIRFCLKERCSLACESCCPSFSVWDHCFRLAQSCDCQPLTVRSCLTDIGSVPSVSKWDCACTCQPPECESCNCLCFEIRIK